MQKRESRTKKEAVGGPTFGVTNIPLLFYVSSSEEMPQKLAALEPSWWYSHKSAILWWEVMLYGNTEAKWKKFRQTKSHVRYLLKEQFIMEAFKESTHVPHDSLVFGPHNVEGRSTPCCGPEKQQEP